MMRIRSVFNSRFLKITEKNQFLKTFWIKVTNKRFFKLVLKVMTARGEQGGQYKTLIFKFDQKL